MPDIVRQGLKEIQQAIAKDILQGIGVCAEPRNIQALWKEQNNFASIEIACNEDFHAQGVWHPFQAVGYF